MPNIPDQEIHEHFGTVNGIPPQIVSDHDRQVIHTTNNFGYTDTDQVLDVPISH